MTDYEMKVLRDIAGEYVPDLIADAALNQALEALGGSGYIAACPGGMAFVITDKGRAAIAKSDTDGLTPADRASPEVD